MERGAALLPPPPSLSSPPPFPVLTFASAVELNTGLATLMVSHTSKMVEKADGAWVGRSRYTPSAFVGSNEKVHGVIVLPSAESTQYVTGTTSAMASSRGP